MTPVIARFPGNNQAIEQIAEGVRTRIESIVDADVLPTGQLLRELVNHTGGTITVVDDPCEQEAEGGSLMICGVREYTIYLSPFTTPLRDNFTIAHEIGHYVLHFLQADPRPSTPVWFARYGTNPIEWQANRFAAALLMPAGQFCTAYERFGRNLSVLSGEFDVSLPAVEVRAKSLGLI